MLNVKNITKKKKKKNLAKDDTFYDCFSTENNNLDLLCEGIG